VSDKVNELEQAIIKRAEHLAEQYRQQGRTARGDTLREANEKLRLREEREVLVAKALAERAYRRKVQSHELKLQAKLDQLRWNLITGVSDQLGERLKDLVADEARYLPMLRELLSAAAAALDADELVVEANERDRARLAADWASFAALVPGKTLTLAEGHIDCIGGLRVRTPDDRIRFDNTFEGRMHRLHAVLHQSIQERLLPHMAEDATAGVAAT
jgi:V/A-type H+-transporting ATPase subunit E